jgi:AcrR family transcriptional regulator
MKTQQLVAAPVETERANSDKPLAKTRKSAKKRAEIVRVATQIINRRSYALATMTGIAAELGLRDATLYYYFPSKQALAYACHVNSLERFELLLEKADAMGETGLDKLRRFIRGLLEDGELYGSQLYFGDYSYLGDAERAEVDAWLKRLEQFLEAFIIDGVTDESMVPCDTSLVVQLIIGMLIWLSKWVPTSENVTVDRLMGAIGITSLDGLAHKH